MNDELLDRLFATGGGAEGRMLLVHGSRGSGKSWWLHRAAARARAEGCSVHLTSGRAMDAPRAEALLLAAHAPRSCVLVDDVDALDAGIRGALRAAIDATGGIAVVTASSSAAFDGALAVRIEPLDLDELARVLGDRGLATHAARRCASAAAGNPGLAVSLADGLSDAQRTDQAAVPELPRLAADVAADLHARLRPLGDLTCRALVVAAADDDGDMTAIRHALRLLGEAGRSTDGAGDQFDDLFDAAEHAAVVDVVGSRVVFVDPWLRLAAYHLVAPASRRAAHRALAAAYGAPRQGQARVRHLVAASSGPSDDVAQALMVVASASARRGDRHGAARMAAQAADLAVDGDVRASCLLRAIGWCLDVGDYSLAEHHVAQLDGVEPDERVASLEVRALLHGDDVDDEVGDDRPGAGAPAAMSEREVATWTGRRRQRRSWWREADAGSHGRLIRQIGGTGAAPAELWARATALRHGGFVRDAAELAERTLATMPAAPSHVRDRWELLAADLDVLGGRSDAVAPEARWQRSAAGRVVLARAVLAATPVTPRTSSSVHVPDSDPLREVRRAMLRGLTGGLRDALVRAAEAAEAAGLPIETGECWMMIAELAASSGGAAETVADAVARATEVLHRCAVRGWDARLAHLLADAEAAPVTAVAAADPALDALTAAEWRVAESVAGGLTNREVAAALFLSVKTVDFHLQQIYRKLAIRSRTELAVRVAGRTVSTAGRATPPTQGAGR